MAKATSLAAAADRQDATWQLQMSRGSSGCLWAARRQRGHKHSAASRLASYYCCSIQFDLSHLLAICETSSGRAPARQNTSGETIIIIIISGITGFCRKRDCCWPPLILNKTTSSKFSSSKLKTNKGGRAFQLGHKQQHFWAAVWASCNGEGYSLF